MARAKRPKPKIPMYTPRERMFYTPCPCDPKPPIGLMADQMDQKLKGGYKTGKNNRCEEHNMVRTATGICIICELDS